MTDDPYVVVVGSAAVDFLGTSLNPLVHRESNPGYIRMEPGGVGRNIAENLSRMGIRTELLSMVGDDPAGQFLIQSCRRAGLGISEIAVLSDISSSGYLVINDPDGEMAWALSDMNTVARITESYLEERRSLVENAAALILDGNLSRSTLEFGLRNFTGPKICCDPVSAAKAAKFRPVLSSIDWIKVNAHEAEVISGIEVVSRDDAAQAAEIMIDRGIGKVFVTLGAEGAFWASETKKGFTASIPVSVVNTTGAGDAFTAGVVYGLLGGRDIGDTARIAAAAAAITLESKSAVNKEIRIQTVLGRAELR